jgi:hypothetical protein
MDKKRMEALAEAIASVSGYAPGSALYKARNPGGLKAFGKAPADENGFRIFNSIVDGWQALIFDTALKLSGASRAMLQPGNTLQDFALSHKQPITAADAYAKFLRRALNDDSITKKTELMYFLED